VDGKSLTLSAVWLKWWSDASLNRGNDRNGQYLGVYAALQIAALLVSAVVTWLVLIPALRALRSQIFAITNLATCGLST
jgi:ABC-type branched-subunit amino acid transport system permease subunit